MLLKFRSFLCHIFSLIFFLQITPRAFSAILWESFEGCNVRKTCIYKTEQEKLMAYAKGLPDIKSKNYDDDFLICHEWFFLCGYVPKVKDGISALSGVTIGIGVDLGRKSEDDLKRMNVNPSTIAKLLPYLGLRGISAVEKLKEFKNLTLTENEALELSHSVKDYYFSDLSNLYEDLKKPENSTVKFKDLHLSIKTALFSLYYNRPKFDYKGFKEALAENDWIQLANIIESLKSNKSRRKAEALLLRSYKNKCQKEMYLSVLMDESGSINQDDFQKEINFVTQLVKSNQDNDKIYMSLLSFSNDVSTLSDFTNDRNALLNELKSHKKISGGTNTGEAIFKSRDLFLKTQSYLDGNLDSRVMIIITDGASNDRSYTVQQAGFTKKSGIQIISIGVGNGLNLEELRLMSDGDKNVLLINDFSVLAAYLENLNAGVCSQNSPIENNKTFSAEINDLASPIYLQIEKSKNNNERIVINDTQTNSTLGESQVVICVSYNDPYPNENSNELCHFGKNSGLKELVMYNKENALKKDDNFDSVDYDFSSNSLEDEKKKLRILDERASNSTINEDEKEILYVAIKGKNVNFTIKAEECDPTVCKFGTNDIPESKGLSVGIIVLIVILCLVFLFGGIYLFFIRNKNKRVENELDSSNYGKLNA